MESTKPLAPHNQGLISIEPGTKLGPYEVQDFIGHGAMGVVYRAYHADLERPAAVKVLQGIGDDPESNARFRREALAIAHMRHPNILNVYDFGEYRGTPYMIVEFVPGGSLADRIQHGPVDQKSAIAFIRGIAEALDYAHSLGIVHRDVKPANVLVGPEDTPILADFGLAKLMESSSIKSITGMTTGTPAYMAPEQVTGSEVGPPADRYSLATIAYELLVGAYPFDGEGVLEMLYAHVHREAPAPSTVNSKLSPAVDAVILRGLAKAPMDRWQSCEAFVDALDAALKAGPASPAVSETIPLVQAPRPAKRPVAPRPVAATAVMALDPPATEPLHTPVSVERTEPLAGKKKYRLSRNHLAALLLIPLLLLGGYCGYNAIAGATLSLSPTTLHAGDPVTVTVAHMPAHQSGEIQLLSVLHRFAVTSDGNGNLTSAITVPADTPSGDHTVRLCWNGACHAQATLRVVGAGTGALATPTATPSGTPATTPRATPTAPPTSNPTSKPTAPPTSTSYPPPTHAPSPQPSPQPSPRPSPRPSPSPTPPPPPPPPEISVSPNHMALLTGSSTVHGQYFGAGKSVTISFVQGGVTKATYGTTASSGGTFAKLITVPGNAALGQATITACDSSNACASATIQITLL